MKIPEAQLDAWIERTFPPGGAYPLPPWNRDGFRAVMESELAIAAKDAATTLTAQRIERLERTVAAQAKEIAKLRRELAAQPAEIIDGMCKAIGQNLPKWREVNRLVFDAGVWTAGKAYPVAAQVTHGGAIYIAQRATAAGERPGTDAWRLAHKTEVAELRRIVREEISREPKA